jgi:NADPH2:quinone reductase
MRAVVVHEPGGPEVLRFEERLQPEPLAGQVLVRVHAFGLNRGELMTRAGLSGSAVTFPRVLGIECVGEVVGAGSDGLTGGQTVVAAVGGMGRDFDGSYQEVALLPSRQVTAVNTSLSWAELGAIPETFGTAWGSLDLLKLSAGQTLLVRGATSSVGMAAITLAKARGVRVVATTRQAVKRAALESNGAEYVVIDNGTVAERVRAVVPAGVDGVLELVGPNAMMDSLQALRPGGNACQTGILEGSWDEANARAEAQRLGIAYHRFTSTGVINRDSYGRIFQEIIDDIQRGRYRLNLDRTFGLNDVVEAHRYMESNAAAGKVVVLS